MNKIFIVLTIQIFLLGCSQDANKKHFSDLRTEQHTFLPTVEDKTISNQSLLSFSLEKSLGIESAVQNKTPWLSDSTELFKLAENSYVLGQNRSRTQYKNHLEVGYKILNTFYSQKENSTQFDAHSSMYLHAALGFEGERIYEKFKNIGNANDTLILQQIFSSPCPESGFQSSDANAFCHSLVWPAQVPELEPKRFIESIISYLDRTVILMRSQNISSEFIGAFEAQIKGDYIDRLNHALNLLKDVKPSEPLIKNAESLVEAVEFMNFLPQYIHQKLSTDLTKGYEYAQTLVGQKDVEELVGPPEAENASNDAELPLDEAIKTYGYRLLNVISNIWIDLNSEQRIKYIGGANEILYDYLSGQSEAFILWMSGRITHDEYGDMCNGWLGCSQEYFASGWWRNNYVKSLTKSCHGDIKKELDSWLENASTRERLRVANPKLFAVFASFQDKTLRDTVLDNFILKTTEVEENGVKRTKITKQEFRIPWTLGNAVMKEFNQKIAPLCLESIQAKLDGALNTYILTSLDTEIRKYAKDIESLVASKTISNQKDIVDSVINPDAFREYFEGKAIPIMEKMLFKGQTLNGIENSKVQLMLDGDNWRTQREDSSVFETSAIVAGTALAANYYKLNSLPDVTGMEVTNHSYYSAVFEQINKMLAMIGFRRMDKTLQQSLHRHFAGDISELDVYKYDCTDEKRERQKRKMQSFVKSKSPDDFVDWREYCEGFEGSSNSFFGFPDRLAIENSFDPLDGIFPNKTSSAVGQSEIIRGASLMLQYFKDWKTEPDDFDGGLGKELFSGVPVFPKHAFVNLTVGLSTIPIRGFQKPFSGLYLFSFSGNEFVNWQKNGMPAPNSPDPVAEAAFADILESGASRIIKVRDLASFIIAIDEFLKATEGIEKTKASVINPPNKKERENLNAIIQGRKLLKLMVAGVSHFMISKLQAPDGGFWRELNLDQNMKDEMVGPPDYMSLPRTLSDQNAVIESLLRAHSLWGGTGTLIAALEAYHFMNAKLFNPKTGIYNPAQDTEAILKPHDYLQILITLNNIKNVHVDSKSKEQARKLYNYYEEKWLEWVQTQKM